MSALQRGTMFTPRPDLRLRCLGGGVRERNVMRLKPVAQHTLPNPEVDAVSRNGSGG